MVTRRFLCHVYEQFVENFQVSFYYGLSVGFDPGFFEILNAQLTGKDNLQPHGILLVEEMTTRKDLLLDRKTNKPTNIDEEMADHGLVIFFQPLYDYPQPIAIFASKRPTCGPVLAKLMVQAIILLESAGAKIHGIVADGDPPGRQMWKGLGCSGKKGDKLKNWFKHPTDVARKVYFFSDTRHLMKTIPNRLLNSKKLRVNPDEPLVEWQHFEILNELDTVLPAGQRLCGKITKSHLNIARNSYAQMRVSLALQLFSKSAARGLRYRAYDLRLKKRWIYDQIS